MTVRDGFTLDAAEGPAAREALLRYAEVTDDDDLAAALRQWVASERRERREVRADGGQATLDPTGRMCKPPAAHLTGDRPDAGDATLDADQARREWWCTECNRRVTRASGGAGEFGHAEGCEYHYQREWSA
jgi:hypothetical protein